MTILFNTSLIMHFSLFCESIIFSDDCGNITDNGYQYYEQVQDANTC